MLRVKSRLMLVLVKRRRFLWLLWLLAWDPRTVAPLGLLAHASPPNVLVATSRRRRALPTVSSQGASSLLLRRLGMTTCSGLLTLQLPASPAPLWLRPILTSLSVPSARPRHIQHRREGRSVGPACSLGRLSLCGSLLSLLQSEVSSI